jgi:HK97 gp10 family phage protein
MATVINMAGLQRLAQDSGKTLDEIIGKKAFEIEGDAKKLAPVETGALRASLNAERKSKSPVRWVIQDGVEYGVFQELGTSRMAAHPFLVPAFEKRVKQLADEIGKAIERLGRL